MFGVLYGSKLIDRGPGPDDWLAALGVFGFFVVNGAFAHGLLFQPDALTAALTNPLAAAFIVEALVLVGVFAYLPSLLSGVRRMTGGGAGCCNSPTATGWLTEVRSVTIIVVVEIGALFGRIPDYDKDNSANSGR